jgi:hypothetical protein
MRKENSFRYHGRAPAVLLCMILTGASISSAQPGKKRPVPASQNPRQTLDDFLNPAGGPLTLAKLLDLLRRVREDIETEGRILRAIEARGVDFPMTLANAHTIGAAGGSAKLMELLQRKAPQPSPPPPPPASPVQKKEEPKGALTVQCEPAECEVAVLGGPPPLRTKNGTAGISGLELGEAFVDFRKPGFIGQQQAVTIKSGPGNSLLVTLEPDNNTQVEFGARLFKAMVEAAGGEASRKELAVFSATGSATVFDTAGAGTEWNLTVTFNAGQATLEARNSAGGLKLECRGETCQAQSGGKLFAKRLSREQAQSLETNLRQFRTYQFAAVLGRIISAGMQAKANTANIPGTGEQRLRLEGKGEAYDISLDTQLLPTFIKFESQTGLGSGLTLGYADYTMLGASRYPRTTEIKLPDGKQGPRVRFGQVSSQPGAK